MSKGLVLYLDSSFKGLTLALGHGEQKVEPIASCSYFSNHIAAAKSPRMVKELLNSHGYELSDVAHLLVSSGPGSFTGIKVGLSFVSALSLSCPHLKLHQVSPLEELSRGSNSAWFIPATKSQGYLGLSHNGNPRLFAVDVGKDSISIESEGSREELGEGLLENKEINLLLPWPKLEEFFTSKEKVFNRIGLAASSAILQEAVLGNFLAEEAKAVSHVEPRYIRKSAPEEILAKKEK